MCMFLEALWPGRYWRISGDWNRRIWTDKEDQSITESLWILLKKLFKNIKISKGVAVQEQIRHVVRARHHPLTKIPPCHWLQANPWLLLHYLTRQTGILNFFG